MAEKIIVLSGKQLSGKDTVAKILLEKLPEFKRVGLGDAIKLEYGRRKNLTFEEIEKNKAQYRADLIALGNEGRAISATYWIEKTTEIAPNLIIPDMRVLNELKYFKSVNAYTIRVNASEEQRLKRGALAKTDDKTETELDNVTDWHYIVENNSTYEDLLVQVEGLLADIKKYFQL